MSGWRGTESGLDGFRDLMLVAQAPGAQVKTFGLAIYGDSSRVDIGYPATVGMPFGVADIVAELR